MNKKCKKCGLNFETSQSRCIYCSRKCYYASRWGTDKCKFCEKPISGKRYCNKDCRDNYWNKNEYQLLKKKRLWERKKEIIEKLGSKCVKCGNSDIRCLDINHIDRTKKGRPKNKAYNMQFRLREWSKNINNLELLCANCHRIHTYKQMNYGNY